MEDVPGPEGKQHSWIYAKGGMFIAQKRKSNDPDNPPRDVLALNYRWKSLGNKLPNRLLIDEIVEIIRKGSLAKAADRLIAATRDRMINGKGKEPSKPDDATIVLYRRTN